MPNEDITNLVTKFTPALGPEKAKEFTPIFYYIQQDVSLLRSQWRIYRAFFGTNKERVDMLNCISGIVANTLERTLFEATLLGLRRLTDTDKGKWKVTSIMCFPNFFEGNDEQELLKLRTLAIKKSDFAKNWSDKKIAHSDLLYRRGKDPLQKASRQKVTDAIDSIADIIKWIAAEKLNQDLMTHPISSANDEVHFLQHLFRGQKAAEENKGKWFELMRQTKYDEARALDEFPEWISEREGRIFDC